MGTYKQKAAGQRRVREKHMRLARENVHRDGAAWKTAACRQVRLARQANHRMVELLKLSH